MGGDGDGQIFLLIAMEIMGGPLSNDLCVPRCTDSSGSRIEEGKETVCVQVGECGRQLVMCVGKGERSREGGGVRRVGGFEGSQSMW